MQNYLTCRSIGVIAAILLVAIVLYGYLKRDRKPIQDVAVSLVLVSVFAEWCTMKEIKLTD